MRASEKNVVTEGNMTTTPSSKDEKAVLQKMLKARTGKLREKQAELETIREHIEMINKELESINHLLGAGEPVEPS